MNISQRIDATRPLCSRVRRISRALVPRATATAAAVALYITTYTQARRTHITHHLVRSERRRIRRERKERVCARLRRRSWACAESRLARLGTHDTQHRAGRIGKFARSVVRETEDAVMADEVINVDAEPISVTPTEGKLNIVFSPEQ